MNWNKIKDRSFFFVLGEKRYIDLFYIEAGICVVLEGRITCC